MVEITTQQFEIFLKKIPLNLKISEISKIILLIDEDFVGKIDEKQYYKFLVSYGIFEESFLNTIFLRLKENIVNKLG